MSALRSMVSGLRSLFGKEKRNAELDDEIQGFLDAAAEHRMAQGMSAQDALRAAKMEMSRDAVKENVWSAGWEAAVDNFWQDLRYSVRMLLKSPGFTLVAVASLALGIGANTAIFTLVNDLLFKSLPVRDPQQLVSFGKAFGGGSVDGIGAGPLDIFTYDFYQRLEREQAEGRAPFSSICGFASFWTLVSVRTGTAAGGAGSEVATQAAGHLVTGDFFSVLGADPLLGRTFTPADADAPGKNPVAVISYRYWQQMFAGDPSIVGRTITVNGTLFTVIGVMPPKFYGVALNKESMDMWLPITMQQEVMLQPSLIEPHGLYWMHMMARRKPGDPVGQEQEWVTSQLQRFMLDRDGGQVTPARREEIRKAYVELLPGGGRYLGSARDISAAAQYSDGRSGAGPADCMRQPGELPAGESGISGAGDCDPPGTGFEPEAHHPADPDGGAAALVCRRSAGSCARISRNERADSVHRFRRQAHGARGAARPSCVAVYAGRLTAYGNTFRPRTCAAGFANQRGSFAGSECAYCREQRRIVAAAFCRGCWWCRR